MFRKVHTAAYCGIHFIGTSENKYMVLLDLSENIHTKTKSKISKNKNTKKKVSWTWTSFTVLDHLLFSKLLYVYIYIYI